MRWARSGRSSVPASPTRTRSRCQCLTPTLWRGRSPRTCRCASARTWEVESGGSDVADRGRRAPHVQPAAGAEAAALGRGRAGHPDRDRVLHQVLQPDHAELHRASVQRPADQLLRAEHAGRRLRRSRDAVRARLSVHTWIQGPERGAVPVQRPGFRRGVFPRRCAQRRQGHREVQAVHRRLPVQLLRPRTTAGQGDDRDRGMGVRMVPGHVPGRAGRLHRPGLQHVRLAHRLRASSARSASR